MKRIKSACLLQTIHFQIKDDIARAAAEREEAVQHDVSVIVKIRKQYNNHNVGDYMD